jgi:Alw26I/Eco31I/Esp3I family type II restriction m6 adenine DNA methyltransferase
MQQGLFSDVWITSGIFSNHYLLERLPQAGSKVWPSDEKVLPKYKAIRELYEKNIVGLRKGNEANTERRFIDKVFHELGFGYLNQTKIPEAVRRYVPDYFLYSTRKDADKAFESSSHEKYRLAISIAESKRWDHNLDQPSSGKGKAPQGRYPHQQIRDYLNESEHIKWGILTNGKEWRLYFKEGRSSKFFEIDLEECLKDLLRFKYFVSLFSPDAFIKDSSGKCLLDYIFEQFLRFQEDVEKDLREKVFKCVEWLGQGFLFREENRLTERDLDSIYHYSLTLLYRILFVLNAEARDLLPTNPQTKYYKHYGIQRIKDRIRQEKREFINAKTTLYDELLALFHLINGDNEKLNKDLKIPRYNGGLFDPEKYSFLEEKKVGDDVLSEVIYELSYRTDKNGEEYSIDYKGLGERHLGTVYEGLLEHKFTFDNGKIVLKNDKGERKATGAYYTPDYIVKYIVENTLGPILKETDKKISSLTPTLLKGCEGGLPKDDSFAREILKLNICDPAMGSGHFLVEAVQCLADEIAYHPTTQLKTPKKEDEDEVNYWKRKVVESCIYGVDIKELAVELAKLSLWLKTVDRSQPLNFLDHHLRCGDSLIGARISDLSYLPQPKGKKKADISAEQLVLFDISRFKEDITAIVKGFQAIEEMPSEKLSDIKAKDKTFKILMEELKRYREIADLWTSLFFGNSLEEKEQVFEELLKDQYRFQMDIFGPDTEIVEKKKSKMVISNKIYNFIVSTLQRPDGKEHILKLSSLLENSETIARERRFFHWELEFPEVFFNEDGSPKENPGFDCVIGNPPYDVLSELEQGRDVKPEKEFFSQNVRYGPAIGSKLNFYRFFSVLSLNLLKDKGMHGFIVPMALLGDKQAKPLREFMLKKNCLQKIEAFPQKDDPTDRVFPEAKLSTCVYILRKEKPSLFFIRIHPGKDIMEVSTFLLIKPSQIEKFDKENLSIPSYPNMTAEDFHLALKMKRVSNGVMLKHFAPSQQGEVNLTEHSEFLTDKDKGQIILRGAHINRYEFQEEPKQGTSMYLDVKRFLDAHGKNTKAYDFKYSRIGYQRGSAIDNWRRIIATIIEKDNFCSDTINYIVNPKEYNLFAILALLNSSLWEWRFRLTSTNNHVNAYEIDSMPMPPISFTTPERERRERVAKAISLYRSEIEHVAISADKWQNKDKVKENDKERDKESSAKARKVAGKPRGYKVIEESISGQDSRLGGKVHGVREGTSEYEPSEGPPKEGEDSTRPLDSTRYFETAQGIKTYSEVSEILAVSVAKAIEAIIDRTPEEINITPEWICRLHGEIAGSLFPDWAGRFRDVNVVVGSHTPPPYFEVPIHVRQYCDDLAARLSFATREQDIETFAETLAFVGWRFQWIHPFKDFNVRVGRILLAAILFKQKLPPAETASVELEEKERYLKALHDADGGDISLLTTIWIERLSKAFYEKR